MFGASRKTIVDAVWGARGNSPCKTKAHQVGFEDGIREACVILDSFDQTPTYQQALRRYSTGGQINKTIEECTELSLALQHYRDGRATVEEVVDELADVFIMVTQMRLLFDGVDERVNFKLNRLTERMNERSTDKTTMPTIR